MNKLMIILFFIIVSMACAQEGFKLGSTTWVGKVEFTQDQGGRQTYDVQNFGQAGKVEIFARGIWVEQSVHRFEFAAGKTFGFSKRADGKHRVFVTQYAGLTTDGAGFAPMLASFNFFGRQSYYLADTKFYHARNTPLHQNTLYQEASVPLTKGGGWQVGFRRLQVSGQVTVSNRIVVERRFWIRNRFSERASHFAVLPFFDAHVADSKKGIWSKSAGFYIDFCWQ